MTFSGFTVTAVRTKPNREDSSSGFEVLISSVGKSARIFFAGVKGVAEKKDERVIILSAEVQIFFIYFYKSVKT